jgi:hypothetical protein
MFDTSENSFCVATCCCNGRFNETFFCYGVSILVIDPTDATVLGMMDVKKMHGKSFTSYLCSHQEIPESITAQRHGLWQVQVA